MKIHKLTRHLVWGLALCLAAGALWLAALAVEIVAYSSESSTQRAQAAVVLGAAAWGNRPSPVYKERINAAIRLYNQGRVGTLIFTGGTPVPYYPSESTVGRDYARMQGVPDQAILVDTQSRSTLENLVQARELMKSAGIKSVLLVSDPLHMKRSMYLAKELGLDAQPAPTDSSRVQSWNIRARFLWRETWSFAAQQLMVNLE
jgi:uncharacterized SAM-binding protein YcdF (DUF218 family)